ncbi:hypothetical protein D6D21_09774 [Aureobasidium pullulans]|uniref:Uncharacterized protein n=1 Tax=Aureobasidium pullulans TaxID=5580 RepID=A0AB74IJT3_AURPU|nr:hypothetical protein D6D21_09774 [Aureobasidium pullulans]
MRTRSASADSFIETEADKLALDHAGQILAFAEEFEEIINVCIVPKGLERALRSPLKKRFGIVNWKGDIEEEEEEGQQLKQIEQEEQTDEEKEEEDQKKPEIAPATTGFMADARSPSNTFHSITSSDSSSEQAQTTTATSPSLTTPSYTKVAPHQLLTIMSGMPDVETAMRLLEYLQQNVSAAIAAGLPNFRVGSMDFNYYSQRVFMSWGYVDVPLVYVEDEDSEDEEISDEETGGDVGAEMSRSPLMAIQEEDSSEQDQSESEVEEGEEETSTSPLMNTQEEGSPELGESENESEVEEGEIIEL